MHVINMRCFVAVELDDALRPKVKVLQEQIKDFDVKLVEPQNMHFTLKFLGEIDQDTIDKVSAILDGISGNFKLFKAVVKGAGAFPSFSYIRVIWVGCDELLSLQSAVEDALSAMFKKEKPTPHLTIARVRSGKYRDKIREFVEQHKDTEIGTMYMDRIKLKKSTLTRDGPIYEDVKIFELKK